MENYSFVSQQEVQHFLNNVGTGEFQVIFMKDNGTQRKLVGTIEVSPERKHNVAMKTSEGWKSFSISKVLMIGLV